MEPQFKTSFIPKKPIETSVDLSGSGTSPRKVGRTIFSLIGIMIFLGSIGGYAATWVWQIKLKSDIDTQIQSLKKARDEFDEAFTMEASRLNTRIQESLRILDNHVSPSQLYALLQDYTRQTVSFSNFSFKDNGDGTISVAGKGDAARYESIVLQSDSFGKSGYLRNVIFTDTRFDPTTQSVSFSFEATLDPKLVQYRRKIDLNSRQN